MEPSRVWCRITAIGPDGGITADWEVRGEHRPGLELVDRIARLALTASRAGGRLVLDEVAPELSELLELVGLPFVVAGIEVQRQPEGGE